MVTRNLAAWWCGSVVESQSLQPHYAAGVRGAQSLLFLAIFVGMRMRRVIMVVLRSDDGVVSDEDIVDW